MKIRANPSCKNSKSKTSVRARWRVLQPLFRALLLVICYEKYDDQDSNSVESLPVYLVSTGIKTGILALISFNSIADKPTKHVDNSIKTIVET